MARGDGEQSASGSGGGVRLRADFSPENLNRNIDDEVSTYREMVSEGYYTDSDEEVYEYAAHSAKSLQKIGFGETVAPGRDEYVQRDALQAMIAERIQASREATPMADGEEVLRNVRERADRRLRGLIGPYEQPNAGDVTDLEREMMEQYISRQLESLDLQMLRALAEREDMDLEGLDIADLDDPRRQELLSDAMQRIHRDLTAVNSRYLNVVLRYTR